MKRQQISTCKILINLIFFTLSAGLSAEDIQELPTIYYTIPAASAEDSAVLYFDKSAIEESKTQTLASFIAEAGSNIKTNGTAGSAVSVYMRGFSGTSIKVFIDGIAANSVQTGLFDFSSISLSEIESIRIIPGAFNADAGAAPSVGGSIYITTLKHSTKKQLKVSLESTSYKGSPADTNKADILFSINKEKSFFSMQGSFIGARNEFLFTLDDGTEKTRKNNDYSGTSAALQYLRYFGNGYSVSVTNATTLADRLVSGSETAAEDDYGQQEDIINRTNFALKMLSLPSGGITMTLGSDFSKQTYTSVSETSVHYIETIPLTVTYRPFITDLFSLNCGLNFTPSFINSTDLNISYFYTSFLKAVPSFTFEHVILEFPLQAQLTSTGFSFIPQGSITISQKKWAIAVSVSSLNQQPTLNQLYWNDSKYAAGNKDLLPESGVNTEANISMKGSKSTTKISLFASYYLDKIQWSPDNSDDGKWKPQNIGKAALFGGAVNTQLNYEKIHFLLNYEFARSYLLSGYTFADNKRIMYTPEHTLAGRINLDLTKHIELWAGIKAVSAQYTSNANVYFLDPYLLVDAGISAKIGLFELFFKGQNLTNTRYYQSEGYPNPRVSITVGAVFNMK